VYGDERDIGKGVNGWGKGTKKAKECGSKHQSKRRPSINEIRNKFQVISDLGVQKYGKVFGKRGL